jgi:hypothetical protein
MNDKISHPNSENVYLESRSLENFRSTRFYSEKKFERYLQDCSKKIYPDYFSELAHYPRSDPTFIAADLPSLKFIQRLDGICLFCKNALYQYDFSFCYQREVWILHSDAEYFPFAMRIAQATQLCDAAKILVLWLTRHHEKDSHHAEC